MLPSLLAKACEFAVGKGYICGGETADGFAKGERNRSGFTDVEGGVVDGDAGGWADGVYGVVAGIQTAALPELPRQIIHAENPSSAH